MTGSHASVSGEAATRAVRVLVCGVNWIGDAVMSMPALQLYRGAHPDHHVTLLVKPAVAPLWALHGAPDEIVVLEPGWRGMLQAARRLRRGNFAKAFVMPHSIRSALIPWLAGVAERRGLPGTGRRMLCTHTVMPSQDRLAHQSCEYIQLMTPECANDTVEPPRLRIPEAAAARALSALEGLSSPRVALLPGAARGPSKRWPPSFFAETGRRLGEAGVGVAVLGSPQERDLCREIAGGAGPGARNLAGELSLPEWIAALAACDLAICNDSGGMHVAAAVGTPLVAIYGLTDPARTGPLGSAHRILQAGGSRNRDIARDSPEARKSLASLEPARVYEAAMQMLEQHAARPGEKA